MLLVLLAVSSGLAPLEVRIGPDIDLISLVVEIGTVIDEGKVGNDEIGSAPLWATRRRSKLFDVRDRIASLAGRLDGVRHAMIVTEGIEALRHRAQGKTVFYVVGEELMFKDRGLGCLPLSPPHDALWPGGLRRRPAAAEIAPNVFETVRVGGEVDIGIDDGKDIYQACQQGFVGCRQAGVLVHPLYERCLIASIDLLSLLILTPVTSRNIL